MQGSPQSVQKGSRAMTRSELARTRTRLQDSEENAIIALKKVTKADIISLQFPRTSAISANSQRLQLRLLGLQNTI